MALQHEISVTSAQFSADGKRIVTSSLDGTAQVWDADNGVPQLELAQPHRHHDRMAAASAGSRGERRQVSGNEHCCPAAAATHHAQRFANFIRCGRHGLTLALNVPTTSLDVVQPHRVQIFL